MPRPPLSEAGYNAALFALPFVCLFVFLFNAYKLGHLSRKWLVRMLLLLAYCVPFAFLCVHGDAASGTMMFYGVMIAGFGVLCWGALKTENVVVLYIGNVLSFASSCAAAKLSGLEPMGHYFKPFTSHSLIVAVSLAAGIVHTIAVLIFIAKKKKRGQ